MYKHKSMGLYLGVEMERIILKYRLETKKNISHGSNEVQLMKQNNF